MITADRHPSTDELLLYSYGEVAAERGAEIDAHVASCAACHAELVALERGRVAADWAREMPAHRRLPWTLVALGAAAVVTAVLLTQFSGPLRRTPRPWPGQLQWSATAGYFAGGQNVIDIDSQLTELEQGWSYGRP
jgi:hypothetical protein